MVTRSLRLLAMVSMIAVGSAMATAMTIHPVEANQGGAGVAVLDMKKIYADSKATKHIRGQIDKLREGYQKEISKDEERIRGKEKELSEQRNLLSPEAFEQEVKKFKDEVTKIQMQVQKKRIQLDRANAKALEEVDKILRDIVIKMSRDNNFAITFPASGVFFYAQHLDITDAVLKELDQKIPSVAVKIVPISDAELMSGGKE